MSNDVKCRPVVVVAGLVLAAALTGCGASTPTAAPATSAPTTPTPSITPTPTDTPTPMPTPTPARTHKPKPTGGNGDSTDQHAPATAGGGICSDITDAEVAHVVGGTFTGSAIPGGPGCIFDQTSQKAPAVTFIETSFAKTSGGMNGAKNDATSSVEGSPEDLSRIGDAAFVVTGPEFGGPYTEGAGAVRVGDRLITVKLEQSTGLSAAKVRSLMVALLTFAAGQVG